MQKRLGKGWRKVVEEQQKDQWYVCQCCKSNHDKNRHPPIAGMCPECHKSKEKTLIALYNEVERPLSLLLQPETPLAVKTIDRIRNDLRDIMREKGFQGPF